jgi:hypothetical protein
VNYLKQNRKNAEMVYLILYSEGSGVRRQAKITKTKSPSLNGLHFLPLPNPSPKREGLNHCMLLYSPLLPWEKGTGDEVYF